MAENIKKRVLIVCTVAEFLHFELNNIKILNSLGFEIYVATNFKGYDFMHVHETLEQLGVPKEHHLQVDFCRSPFSTDIIRANKQIKEIVFKYRFSLMHCHTPVGGVLARLAAKDYNDAIERRIRERKSAPERLKVIYTAHGFHFYDGAPIKNWLLFYPVEKELSRITDVLITINKEDYKRAKEKFYAKKTVYVPGVGVDVKKFTGVSGSIDRNAKRQELGLGNSDTLLLSVGELNENKNHSVVIKALGELQKSEKLKDNHIIYMIAGAGDRKDELEDLAAEEDVDLRLLGFRKDVSELLTAADLYILPSIREGLNVSLMEAMASGTPCLAGNIRGNVDLIDTGKGGELFDPQDVSSVAETIAAEVTHRDNWSQQGAYNQNKIKHFDLFIRSVIEDDLQLSDYRYLSEVIDGQKVRSELGIKFSDYLLISVGELSERKNQIVVLKALNRVKRSQPEIGNKLKYILVGIGSREEEYREFIKTHDLEANVQLLGFRSDIPELLRAADLFVFPSYQEGLPVALMEAMSSGVDVICSRIRGNTDLVSDGIFDPDDVDEVERLIVEAMRNGHRNSHNQEVIRDFSTGKVENEMRTIYCEL